MDRLLTPCGMYWCPTTVLFACRAGHLLCLPVHSETVRRKPLASPRLPAIVIRHRSHQSYLVLYCSLLSVSRAPSTYPASTRCSAGNRSRSFSASWIGCSAASSVAVAVELPQSAGSEEAEVA